MANSIDGVDILATLGIEVKTITDKKQAENTIKQINKYILQELKDGSITIPTELELEKKSKIVDKEALRKIRKYRSEMDKLFRSMKSMGFYSNLSEEAFGKEAEQDIGKFIRNYIKLSQVINSTEKASKKSLSTFGSLNKLMQARDVAVEKVTKRTEKLDAAQKRAEARAVAKQRRQEKRSAIEVALRETGLYDKAEKNAKHKDKVEGRKGHKNAVSRLLDISKQYQNGELDLKSAQSKVFSLIGLKKDTKLKKTDKTRVFVENLLGLGTGKTTFGDSSELLKTSAKRGGYRSKLEGQTAQSRREEYGPNKKSLRTKEVSKEEASKMAEDAHKSGHGKKLTNQEKMAGLADAILPLVAREIGAIQHDRPDASYDKLTAYIESIQKFNDEATRPVLDTVLGLVRMATNKFFKLENFFDIGEGDNDYSIDDILPTDKNYAIEKDPAVINIIKSIFRGINKQLSAEEVQKALELDASRWWARRTATKDNPHGRALNEEKKHKYGPGVSVASRIADELMDPDKLAKKTAEVFSAVPDITTTTKETMKKVLASEEISDAVDNTIDETTTKKRKRGKNIGGTGGIPPIGLGTGDGACPCEGILQQILEQLKSVHEYTKAIAVLVYDLPKNAKGRLLEEAQKEKEQKKEEQKEENKKISKTNLFWKPDEMSKREIGMSQRQRQRLERYGFADDGSVASNGDVIKIGRRKALWGRQDNPFADIDLTEALGKIDVDKITDALQKSIEGRMFRAQTGGLGAAALMAMTGGLSTAFTPSLEKSRAKADAANQLMANVRDVVQTLLQNIASKQNELAGFEREGQIKFSENGKEILEDTSKNKVASATVAQMEEFKAVLRMVLADTAAFNDQLARAGGNASKVFRHFEFLSPVLREQNKLIQNSNNGLDKNGKALKHQTRLAEILDYTFQRMGRRIGQMLQNWLLQLNPITQIKKMFTDFTSYSVKWQRTMNVIKYNLRAIIRPFMERIAQALVNAIGFLDIISMKIQEAFGNTPISVFDQAAADTEKMHEELEAASNVTAGFDELHDIGSDNSAANNLLGEIYKPQLSEEWKKLAEDIGDLFKGLITGDLGFEDALKTAGELLGRFFELTFKKIGEFLDQKVWPLIKDKWQGLLMKLIGLLAVWEIGKLILQTIWNKLIGSLFGSEGTGMLAKVGKWLGSAFTGSAAEGTMLTAGTTLGQIFAVAFTSVLLTILGTALMGSGISELSSNTAYNRGLMDTGGNKKDKKDNVGGVLKTTGGGALAGAGIGMAIGSIIPGVGTIVGGVLGAAIGAVAGALTSILAPAFEEVEIAARKANNEMQSIEYYEGAVKGAQTQVDILDELLNVLNQTLQEQTDKVYAQGTELGISRQRMDELVKSTQDGTFETSMLTGAEIALSDSLIGLMTEQGKVNDATERLTAAKKKLLKAETDLAIAQDIEAGNYELAAARIELAEAQEVYETEEATKKRIQLFKMAGDEEKKNLLQDLSEDQRKRMFDFNEMTDKELGSLQKSWQETSDSIKKDCLSMFDEETQNKINGQLNGIDAIINQHKGVWQGIKDTFLEVVSFGNIDTWTYNTGNKTIDKIQSDINAGKKDLYSTEMLEELKKKGLIHYAVGTNYVPMDGLAYLHQGEAVIPKKYNQPYQASMSPQEQAYMAQMMTTMQALNATIKQGISVNGEFTQRGSDLVAVVNRTKSQTGSDLLSNVAYAR